MAEHLELPRPLRLVRTAAWSLSESAGLPIGAIAIAAWLGGRDIGILTGLGVTCVIAAIRKLRTGTIPGLLAISVMLLTVQTIVVLATGSLWIFLLHFPVANLCLCALFARSASGPNPLCARLAAEMIALRQPATHQPGLHRFFQRATVLWAVIFLLLAASLAVLLATEPTATFILLSSLATIGHRRNTARAGPAATDGRPLRGRSRRSAWCEAGVLRCKRQHVGKFCGQHPLRLAEAVPGRGLDPEQDGRVARLVVL
jgi:hypothetical protein